MNSLTTSYLEMPETRLLALLDLDFKKVLTIELAVVDGWIKNKKCKCSEHLDIQSRRLSLDCKHLNKAIKEKIKEQEKIRKLKSDVLLFRNLSRFKRVQQRLDAV